MLSYLTYALSVLHGLIVVGTTLRLLLREDVSASARMAWFGVIASLPVAGLTGYLLIGEVWYPRRMTQRHDQARKQLQALRPEIFDDPNAAAIIPAPYDKPFSYAQTINGFPAVGGTATELVSDAAEAHRRLIADIDAARSSVNIIYYIWLTDTSGTEIAKALMRAAQRGVTCRASADNLGSRALIKSDLWRQMAEAGVQLQIAMPFRAIFRIWLTARFDLRNHRKFSVIDGKTAWVGSKNAADPDYRPKAKFGPWIDIMMRVQGPVVHQFQALFIENWFLGHPDDGQAFDFNAEPQTGGCIAQFRGTGPLQRVDSASQTFCTLFELARSEILITTPYFVPNPSVIHALQSAALRGVAVTLTVPALNDSWIVKAASHGSYLALLEAGVRIAEHGPGLLHAKITTVDRLLTLLGSTNLDMRSFDLNFENDLMIYGAQQTAAVRTQQLAYLDRSCTVSIETMENRSIYQRLRDNLMATLGPIL